MNEYQKKQLKRLRQAQIDLKRIVGDLTDIYGTDHICALCSHVAECIGQAEFQFRIEHAE